MRKNYIGVILTCLILGGCQSSSQQSSSSTLPSEASWRGYKTNKPECIRHVQKLKSLEAAGYVSRKPQSRKEKQQLFEFMNASELLRIRKSCWSAPPPDQPGVQFTPSNGPGNNITAGKVLSVTSLDLPAGVDKSDKLAVDLYQDMVLTGYTVVEANSVVGSPLWNELLSIRHNFKS